MVDKAQEMGGFPAAGQDVQRHTQPVCYYKFIRNSGLGFRLVGEKMAQSHYCIQRPSPSLDRAFMAPRPVTGSLCPPHPSTTPILKFISH